MKKNLLGAALGIGAMLVAGQAAAEGQLHIFNWGNYTSPKLLEKFSKAYDVKVTLDGYDSNDAMLAKVKAGASGYDIVVPSDYMVEIMVKEGLLEKTEPNQLANFKYMRKEFVNVYWDPGRHYTVPWQWGTTGISVNTKYYKGDINTWAMVFDPPDAVKGKINMVSEMTDVIAAGLYYLGYPQCNSNKVQLKALNAMLQKAKKNWRTIDYGVIEKLTSEDVYVSQNWNGASMRARLQVPTIKYAYPREGMVTWMDNVAVLKGAKNVKNARLFQNFIMAPENAALISNFARYANGIKGSEKYMDPEMVKAPEIVPPAYYKAVFIPPCSRKVTEFYTKIWNNLLK